ncbi:MAG: N-acetyltransferase family protein [Chitinophagaceae bacterium]
MPSIRLAKPADSKSILDIYAPYIQNTSLTFEIEVPSIQSFAKRIETYMHNWPWLVCEVNGVVTGYAYASRYRERTAYQWSVECSVYIHDDFQKAGIGNALYMALFEILKRQSYNNVYAVINLPNDKSVVFHEKCGFKYFATFEKVGYKLGQWKNVGWWRLIVNDFIDDPPAPIPFSALDKDFLPDLFEQIENPR